MTRLEAFGVQLLLLCVIVLFASSLLFGVKIEPDVESWIQRVWDVILVLLSPSAFAAAIQKAYNRGEPDESKKPDVSTTAPTV